MSDNHRLPNDACFDLKIFIKDVHDTHGRKRPLTVRPWATVKDVKDQLTKHLHVPASSQGIYFGPLLSSAKDLPNHRTLQDAGIYRNGETLLLEIKGASLLQKGHAISSLRSQANDICVSSSTLDLCPKALQRLVQQARRGLTLGFKPALAPDGSGGSYFLSDARRQRVGVFKPADEEPFAENNPRGYVAHGAPSSSPGGGDAEWLRQGVRPGELCLREVAAYLLDHDGFAGVPPTTLAEARHPGFHTAGANWTVGEGGAGVGVHALHSPLARPATSLAASSHEAVKKVGSFQEFVYAECTMDDISPSKVSVDEVHKIAILDIRLLNADRNVANILCRRIPEEPDHFRLVPIDHGYSLRSKCDVAWFDWCWLDWPQTKQPLSKASREYVLGLDVEADVRLLKERLNMQNDVLDYFRCSCLILKAGVRAGLTLYDICSEIMCRSDPSGEIQSKFETLTTMASELAMSAVHNGKFQHATASLALEEQLTTRHLCMPGPSAGGCPGRMPTAALSSFKSRPIGRSASSSVFPSRTSSFGGESAFTDEISKMDSSFSGDFFDSQIIEEHGPSPCPPGLFHSSQSDNSNLDEEDADACSFASKSPSEDGAADEWAAALVALADQNKESAQSLLLLSQQHRGRSTSESSSGSDGSSSTSSSLDAFSKSPAGFWHVRPGSLSLEIDSSEDNEPICWTPSLQSSRHASSTDSLTCEDQDVENVGPLHTLSPGEFSTSNLGKLLVESPTVQAGFATPVPDKTCPSSETSDDEFGVISSPVTDQGAPLPAVSCRSSFQPLKKKAMSRSMSYSAFSSHNNGLTRCADLNPTLLAQSSALRTGLSSTQENNLFRTYFMKFVDLLVVREMERLLHNTSQSMQGLTI